MSKRLFILLLLSSIVLGCVSRMPVRRNENLNHSFRAANTPSLNTAYGRIPLHFEANLGQTNEQVKFLTRGPWYTMFLTASEAVLALRSPDARESNDHRRLARAADPRQSVTHTVLRMSFPGANPAPHVEGWNELPGKVNYFRGKDPARWRSNVPTYARVHYQDLYPGIDLVYYGNQRELEYDFVVRPGADPARIVLGFRGADRLEVNAEGDLLLHTAAGVIRQRKPQIYQELDGVRHKISGGYWARARIASAFGWPTTIPGGR